MTERFVTVPISRIATYRWSTNNGDNSGVEQKRAAIDGMSYHKEYSDSLYYKGNNLVGGKLPDGLRQYLSFWYKDEDYIFCPDKREFIHSLVDDRSVALSVRPDLVSVKNTIGRPLLIEMKSEGASRVMWPVVFQLVMSGWAIQQQRKLAGIDEAFPHLLFYKFGDDDCTKIDGKWVEKNILTARRLAEVTAILYLDGICRRQAEMEVNEFNCEQIKLPDLELDGRLRVSPEGINVEKFIISRSTSEKMELRRRKLVREFEKSVERENLERQARLPIWSGQL